MEFLEDQQNSESSEWTVDTKACELKIYTNYSLIKYKEICSIF